jgi:tRNA-2-methylthio-N6-dimethylallyladenosine synthase
LARKLFVKTYGCQMNVYDSARMADVLAPHGYVRVDDADDADLLILNTCHIREKAAEKVYSELGRLRRLKPKNGSPGTMIAVAGCVAQAEREEMIRRAPHVDIVVGPQAYHRLPELVARAAGPERHVVDTDFPAEPKFDHLPGEAKPRGPSAFVTVQEGCDKFCAFCVVPYTRGAEYSRPAADVITEIRRNVEAGAREITLLGQNVNAYHGEAPDGGEWRLGRLIRALAEIDCLERIRYTTSHPRDMDADLVAAHGEVPQLMPFLHLPVQSGSNSVLAAMNRGHRGADYLQIVDQLRQARPDIALSSDFIVGHPGETDEDFEQTLTLIREVEYAQAYSFKYSRRPGTPASAQPGQVPETVKADRLAELQGLLSAQQMTFNRRFEGQVVKVLFDRSGSRPNQIAGRSPHMQAVHVDYAATGEATRRMGTIAEVEIVGAHANSLAGTLADAVSQSEIKSA